MNPAADERARLSASLHPSSIAGYRSSEALHDTVAQLLASPPFVLSPQNAKAYFDPSALVKSSRKHTLRMLLERPKLVKRFAQLLKDDAEITHVYDHPG